MRSPTDENHAAVEAVLDGYRAPVKTLDLEPGDLQVFKGRYALHRVTPVAGERKQYVAIFSFVEEPGMVGSPERTRQLYGRGLPIHRQRAGLRRDALIDGRRLRNGTAPRQADYSTSPTQRKPTMSSPISGGLPWR